MSLAAGTTLAHYRITAELGAGGMGEVWRAEDTKLGREVALKVLPEEFAKDPERMARFEREARVLASLNHPNIATLYGLETVASGADADADAGQTTFLAMELVEGEDLSERINRGPIPVDEAIPIALQIAEALEAAHEAGIVHRDLKPANIKLTEDGVVKVLDFGLAKAWESEGADSSTSMSPTMTAHATAAGVILGTAAYMSPEQARGKKVDRRADIWAYGVVLWEMLTGHKLFEGDTASDVLASVLKDAVDLEALPADTPVGLRRLLRRALVKDPKLRLRDIGDASMELREIGSSASESTVVGRVSGPANGAPRWMWGVVVGALAVAGLAVLMAFVLREEIVPQPARRFDIATEGVSADNDRQPVISPDGSMAVWSRNGTLWLRKLGGFDSIELEGTRDARYPFWSPDSRFVGFLRSDRVWKIAVDGGPAIGIGTVPPQSMTGSGGGEWGRDGRILLAGSAVAGLFEISEFGGEATEFVPINEETEADFHHVNYLPGDNAILVTVHRRADGGQTLEVIKGSERKVLFGGPDQIIGSPVYAPTGHILFERRDTSAGLWALPFSPARLEVEGPPFLVIPEARMPSLADDGTLLLVRGGFWNAQTLVWVGADGGMEPILGEPRAYGGGVLSPDGSRIVFSIEDVEGTGLWIHDLERSTTSRLTHSRGINVAPIWFPDGDRIVFASDRSGLGWNLYVASANGNDEPALVSDAADFAWPSDVTADGRFVVVTEFSDTTRTDISMVDLESGSTEMLVGTAATEEAGVLSPGGSWLAYVSDETGVHEVYVMALGTAGSRWQISGGGGRFPRWSRGGDRLFYRQEDRVMMVDFSARGSDVEIGRQLVFAEGVGADRSMFEAAATFDVSTDGQKMLMVLPDTSVTNAPRLGVVLGFLDELQALAEESKQ